MKITSQAIEKDRVTIFVMLMVTIAGVMAYLNSPRNEDPGFVVRQALVHTAFPGASPQRVEELVTDKLEKRIQEIPEIDFLESESVTGLSIIYVNIKMRHKNVRPIWDSLRRKVNSARLELPQNVIGPVVNDEFGDVFGVVIGLTGDGYSYAQLKDVADQFRDALLLLDDVAKVNILGNQEERIFVEVNNERAAAMGISPVQLQNLLQNRNIILPGGSLSLEGEKIALEPTGDIKSVEDLGKTVIAVPGLDGTIFLEDLVTVTRGYEDPPATIMHTSGVPGLGLAISMRQGGNILDMGQQVKAVVAAMESELPLGIRTEYLSFLPDDVDDKIQNFMSNLFQAIVIVIAVMLTTLGFRTGMVVASLLPTALVMTFMWMGFFSIGIDQVSLASLIISLGLLVDNGIVVCESTMVKISEGKTPKDSAVETSRELSIPLLVASLTTAAAFLPIFLAESEAGEFCAPLFKVVTICLLSSWFLSITVIPLLCVRFVRVPKNSGGDGFSSRFYQRYRGVLIFLLKRRILSLLSVVSIFILALFGMTFVPQVFFPPNAKGMFTAKLALPRGTDIRETEEMLKQVEGFMQKELVATTDRPEGITNWAGFVGAGPPRMVLQFKPEPYKEETAYLMAQTTSYDFIVNDLPNRIESFVEQHFPDAFITVKPMSLNFPPDAPVEFRISGPDIDAVFGIVNEVKEKLRSIPGTVNIRDDWGARTKKLRIKIDEQKATRAGLTNLDVAVSLQSILSGFKVTEYREGDKVIPVSVRSDGGSRKTMAQLEDLNVFSQRTGQSTPLQQVADIEVDWEPSQISRRDRVYTVTVIADVGADVSPIGVSVEVDKWLKGEANGWPLSTRYEVGGDLEASTDSDKSIQDKLPIAGLLIAILLVAQFNSIRKPVIVFLSILLGLIGVIIGLLVTGAVFGFMTLLGIIALSGIVINNAIVLLDRIKVEIDDNGLDPSRAIIEATQQRLRPILVATGTTVLGLLPLWYGGGPMWEPMAIAIIFGLLFATVLTLGVVPILYSVFFGVKFTDFEY